MSTSSDWNDVRRRRLQSDWDRMRKLTANSDLIRIESTEGDPPDVYEIGFRCRGVRAPGPYGPELSKDHRVWIRMPPEYPSSRPQMRWLTPIFHPNINAEGTEVCIDAWYPSKFLDDLCIMLGRMIQYQNYNPYSCLRLDAAKWSLDHRHMLPVDRRPLVRGQEVILEDEPPEIRFL